MADAKPAVERLSEDESLRGDLSDVGFGPLLDWAVAAVEKFAPQAADSDALDGYTSRVRGVVQSAVQAAQDSKLEDSNALLDFDPTDKEKVLAALKAVTFGDDPDENAVQLASALQSGLSSAAPAESPAPASTASTPAQEEPKQEAAPAAPETAQPVPESESVQEAAQPQQEPPQGEQKKNEEAGASANPPTPSNSNLNPEPPQQEATRLVKSTSVYESTPKQEAAQPHFLDNVRNTVGQVYNSAWGIFKGLSKRRSG